MKNGSIFLGLFLLASIISASIAISNASVTGVEHGIISIAFDDSLQGQYDYAWPLMKSKGMVGTFYIVTDSIREFSGNNGFMNLTELHALESNGCEIASHGKTHTSFFYLSEPEIRNECVISKNILQNGGFRVNNFAFPYGYTNESVNSIVSEYYRSGRSAYVQPYLMSVPYSQFNLTGADVETGNSSAQILLKNIVDQVYSSNTWAVILFNDVVSEYSANSTYPFQIDVQDFSVFLNYVASKGVKTLTVNQVLDLTDLPVSSPPGTDTNGSSSSWFSSSPGSTSTVSTPSPLDDSTVLSNSSSPNLTSSSSPIYADGSVSDPSFSASVTPLTSPIVSSGKTNKMEPLYLYGFGFLLILFVLIAGIVIGKRRRNRKSVRR